MGGLRGLLIAGGSAQDELSVVAGGEARHLLPVANKPLLDYGLGVMRDCGIEDIAVVVSAETAEPIREALAARRDSGFNFGTIQLDRAPTLPEAMAAAAGFIGDGRCLAHVADGLVASPLDHLAGELLVGDWDALFLVREAVELEGSSTAATRPLRLVTDRIVPPAEQALAGVYCFGPRAVKAAIELCEGGRTPQGVHELMSKLIDRDLQVETRKVGGAWKYSGNVDGLLEANRLVLDEIQPGICDADLSGARIEGRVSVHPTAVLDRTTVRGPAVIGPGAVLVDTFVGPYTAIGADVRLEGTEIEHSIVLPRATIRHLGRRIEDSLVGQDATLVRDFAMPASLRLRVGRGADISLA